MEEVQKIECINDTWFVMSFQAAWNSRMSESTGNYPILQSRTIDLAATTFPEGIEVWPVVSAVLGQTQASDDRLTFKLNDKTAVYKVRGTITDYSVDFVEVKDGSSETLPGFPSHIPINRVPYKNWSGSIDIPLVWTCAPRTADDVVEICNWAKNNGYKVRPRGIMHNWSPLSISAEPTPTSNVLFIDTTKALNTMEMLLSSDGLPNRVKVGAGATMDELLKFLERQPDGQGSAQGFSFPHTPAPEHLTVGGVLAINGHGSGVRTPPNDDFPCSYGSMSNHILEIRAVVTNPDGANPEEYTLYTFKRGEKDTTALLTQLGRSMIVEVTLQVIDNYNMRCQSFMDISASDMFARPGEGSPTQKTIAYFLEQSGRIEAIWYPFTEFPWLKVWTVEPNQPSGSRAVDEPNNYPFSDNLETEITELIKAILGGLPPLTPIFGTIMEKASKNGLKGQNLLGKNIYPESEDIWGPSKNTLFYVKDTTLRVTANGYAILMQKANVQNAIADFTDKFREMLYRYQNEEKYPINSPVEIRATSLDKPDEVPGAISYGRPVISSIASNQLTDQKGWDVALWIDVLTLPGTPHSNEFFSELEKWFLEHFTGDQWLVVPEWSKGWAYTKDFGPWTDPAFFEYIRQNFTTDREDDDNWQYEVNTLAKYDKFNLFFSPLLENLFVDSTKE
ncbi:cholesterol oxidase substrate-binding domain-containing protein [Okeania sp. SIO1I7]|uniref:cholesterol oxidase substrate-binding domain-containing protein n=1 Tax=Okeania sp. SIO1I7 TaxID=2607772 RepID=UPI0013F7D557|nr:cholesterol oxidase substrate-binding domain-containing protein [Okeania sp. SIO1I7]NET24270.1 FAD-binding protein [Okeania sp. SIO1I7]